MRKWLQTSEGLAIVGGISAGLLVIVLSQVITIWLALIIALIGFALIIPPARAALFTMSLWLRNASWLLIQTVRNLGAIWALLFGACGGALGIYIVLAPTFPKEVIEARNKILVIGRLRPTVSYATSDLSTPSVKKFLVNGYELVVQETLKTSSAPVPGAIIRTYIHHGQKLADDIAGNTPNAIVRDYFRTANCRIAREYLNGTTTFPLLEYWPHCTGTPKRYDLSTAVALPAWPVFGYGH